MNVILAFKLQKAYFHPEGSAYFGERAENLKVRLLDYPINVSRFNAFYKTMLEAELVRLNPDKVTLIGVNTNDSILFTAEELRNRGYNTNIIEPLTASEDGYLQSLGVVLLKNLLGVDVEKGI